MGSMSKDGVLNLQELPDEAVRCLPTVEQLVETLKQEERQRMAEMGGWENYASLGMSLLPAGLGILSSHVAYINEAESNQFLVNRLQSGRYSLKPNLRGHPFLYRGQRRLFGRIEPSYRHSELPLLIHNLKVDEFNILLDSHPLVQLFNNGIILGEHKRPFFFEMNYYGLAQHYNFCTALTDFSSDIDVASFFAVTHNLGDDEYEPVTDTRKERFGVLYQYEINPHLTFSFEGFSSIGLQVFPRSGAQKGFLQNEDKFDINQGRIRKRLFRHDAQASQRVFLKFGRGAGLFPDDELAPIAKQIRDSRKISHLALARNSYWNSHEDVEKNMQVCREHGFEFDSSLHYMFLPETLHSLYADIKNGLWEKFCRQIHFEGENSEYLLEKMLQLPKSSGYAHFFQERYLPLLNYHLYAQQSNSLRNLRRVKGTVHWVKG